MLKFKSPFTLLLVLAAVALAVGPVTAAVKAMNLEETMRITTGMIHGTVVKKDVFRFDVGDVQNELYTRLTVEGEELRTGEKTTVELFYLGGVENGVLEAPNTAPKENQTRVGAKIVAFYWFDSDLSPGGANKIFHFGNVFQVLQGAGDPTVISMGVGSPVPQNIKLSALKSEVGRIHQKLLAEKRK